jgi:hypothetical protein
LKNQRLARDASGLFLFLGKCMGKVWDFAADSGGLTWTSLELLFCEIKQFDGLVKLPEFTKDQPELLMRIER